MSLNAITINKATNKKGRIAPSKDNISALIFYATSKPSGFATPYIQKVLSLAEAESLGIVDTFSDETKAAATYKVTNKGGVGDTLTMVITDYSGATNLGTYINGSNATVDDAATAINAFINAYTYLHGYTSTVLTDTVTVKPPAGKGIALNSGTPIVVTIGGSTPTLAGTLTQFSGGVASLLNQYHYQVSEFFRIQPNGELWLMFADVPGGAYSFSEISTLQNYAKGEIRQMAIFANAKTSSTPGDYTAEVAAVNLAALASDSAYAPASIIYARDIISYTSLSTLPDFSAQTYNRVSTVISMDMAARGWGIYKTTGKSVPTLGAVLGAISLAKVSEDIGWTGKFNYSDGIELETIGFTNGNLDTAVSTALQTQIDGWRYIFMLKSIGQTGTWVNDDHCTVVLTSDYAYICDNRTIDKAIRVTKDALFPYLKSNVALNSDGTLQDKDRFYFQSLVDKALNDNMLRNDELSSANGSAYIDPTQNVKSTSNLTVQVTLNAKGVLRTITVNIGF
jgi:hypothetical protein